VAPLAFGSYPPSDTTADLWLRYNGRMYRSESGPSLQPGCNLPTAASEQAARNRGVDIPNGDRRACNFGAATGLNYPDALAGGVYMATGGRLGPMLLVNTHAPLPAPITTYLGLLGVGTQGYVFGGPLAVGDDVLTALDAAIG